jgi:hypothetical protein
MFTRVTPKHFILRRRSAFLPDGKRFEQRVEALGRLRMIDRGMELPEARMCQDFNRLRGSASSLSGRIPCARPTR